MGGLQRFNLAPKGGNLLHSTIEGGNCVGLVGLTYQSGLFQLINDELMVAGSTAALLFFFRTVVSTGLSGLPAPPSEESISESVPPSDLALLRGEPNGRFLLTANLAAKSGFGERPGGRVQRAIMVGLRESSGGRGTPLVSWRCCGRDPKGGWNRRKCYQDSPRLWRPL